MPSRVWFIVAAIWIAGALAWFAWSEYTLAHDAASILCGYPDSAAKDFATCMTVMQTRASAEMWNRFFAHDCLWALLPAAGIMMLGRLVRRRRATT